MIERRTWRFLTAVGDLGFTNTLLDKSLAFACSATVLLPGSKNEEDTTSRDKSNRWTCHISESCECPVLVEGFVVHIVEPCLMRSLRSVGFCSGQSGNQNGWSLCEEAPQTGKDSARMRSARFLSNLHHTSPPPTLTLLNSLHAFLVFLSG